MAQLTQKEILTALLEGKKIRQYSWNEGFYIHLKDDEIVKQDGDCIYHVDITDGYWELYIETVSFFEALEDMKNGKRIKQLDDNCFILY